MAIDLNHLQYGAQFDAFVDFASTQRDPGWIACIEGQKPGDAGAAKTTMNSSKRPPRANLSA